MADNIPDYMKGFDLAQDDWGFETTTSVSTAQPQQPTTQEKISRNASCVCGSGKKYKNCCGALSKD